MGFYRDWVEPALITCACSMPAIQCERAAIVPEARGRVLEVGFGSGLNANFYDARGIERLYALEPSMGMRRRAAKRVSKLSFPVEWIDLPGEQIPLANASVDCVLITFTLCTIPDAGAALVGAKRVLRPGGRLIFLEHGAAPDLEISEFQNKINGLWGRLAGGCNLNRNPVKIIEAAGIHIVSQHSHYAPGAPKFAGFISRGVASA